ncbi:NAD-dependent deacylase [Rhodocyclus tenuis]|uniref:protein acetyllysine N-acetyltransferase n=1 Tax=Rhodocyclus gracilis TaxID=2929842 RepID=A0ABX0WJ02_9RHOO|nr:NAD-dependent deacylase [Rhodocyclus gracilis]NJA89698.1 NAD-dependent deacylase [Rhodocyclus gracilis]
MSLSEETSAMLDAVAAELARARNILFITGAGISADSGLPTYRGFGGLYNDEVTTDEGLSIEEALSAEVFAVRPDITWKYLAHIAQVCRGARPNAAHRAIAAIEAQRPGTTVLTQNIDGLHRLAGSRALIEIHGNLQHLSCTDCTHREPAGDLEERPLPPRCPVCGGVLRPDVVLFSEALPEKALRQLSAAEERGFDLVFSIGTSSIFPYIAQPVLLARATGIPTVEINPHPTRLTGRVDYPLALGAAEAMREILSRSGVDAA